MFLIASILIPALASAQVLDTPDIEFDQINIEGLSEISLSDGGVLDFLGKAWSLGSKLSEMVSKVWTAASSFVENITGLTLKELLVGMLNATIGIVELIVDALDGIL